MKKIFLMTLVLTLSISVNAEGTQPVSAAAPTAVAVSAKPTIKKLSAKQKIQKFWNKIANFDFQSLNIIGQTEKFVAGKKKQNLESVEGVETGVWKNTKRIPASGKAKEIADQLDKTTQEKLNKYNSIESY